MKRLETIDEALKHLIELKTEDKELILSRYTVKTYMDVHNAFATLEENIKDLLQYVLNEYKNLFGESEDK